LAVAENVIGGPLGEAEPPIKLVAKHNLNKGQMRKMYWLPFVDRK
jgi:hypothetical protein